MPSSASLLAFVIAALALLVTPGPAVLFVVTRSVQLGRRAGLLATLGLCAGGLVHVAASVVGLSALLARSASLLTVVKLVGAAYLVYLGIRALTRGPTEMVAAVVEVTPARRDRLFIDGLVVSLFNPKTALFFLAFLPQFARPEAGPMTTQLLALGLVFVGLALITDSAYALAAGSARGLLAREPRFWRVQRYASGAVYIGLGVFAGLSGRSAS